MARIETVIQPFTKTPSRQNPATFSEDMDSRLSEENSRIVQMNEVSSQMNGVASEVNLKAKQVFEQAVDGGYSQEAIQSRDNLQNEATFNAFGYIKELKKSDRFIETNTPYVIKDKGGDAIRFTKGLVNRDSTENIHLPLAPFADGSGDEVLSHSDNGFATQSDHKVCDIVHFGNSKNIIDSYSDTSDTENWVPVNDANISVSNDILTVNADSTDYPYAYYRTKDKGFISGSKYKIKCTLGGINPKIRIYDANNGGTITEENGSGEKTITFVSTDTTKLVLYMYGTGDDDSATFSDLKAEPVEQTYQATTSTTAGDLVTDSTKFSKIDFVSRQDVIFIGEDGKYKTIKGYHNFPAGFSIDDVAIAYGCTKVGKGLFSVTDLACINYDGTEITYTGEITAISLVSRLNSKMYDVAHNPFGSRKDSDDKFWYEVNNQDTYITLLKDVNSTSGRVDENNLGDKKLDDKVYFEGLGGLIFRNTLSVKPNKKDLLEDETNKLVGVDEISEECGNLSIVTEVAKSDNDSAYIPLKQTVQAGITVDKVIIEQSDGTLKVYEDYLLESGVIYSNGGFTWIKLYNTTSERVAGNLATLYLTSNQLLQQGKALTLDVIGNPAKYTIDDSPSDIHSDSTDSNDLLRQGALCWNVDENKMYVYLDTDDRDDVDMTAEDFSDTAKYEYVVGRYSNSWYDRLDSGLSLPFNALLVGQDGTDLTHTDNSIANILSKKLIGGFLLELYRYTPNQSFTLNSNVPNTVSNSYTTGVTTDICFYQSLPSPTTQADPKQVLIVSDKVLASNSHSWHQGGGIVNAVTGKVSVGNGRNGFDGKRLNGGIVYDYFPVIGDSITYKNGVIVKVTTKNGFINAESGDGYYMYTNIYTGTIVLDESYTFSSNSWAFVLPLKDMTHPTINLDNSDSPAAKAFTTLCVDDNDELLVLLNGEGMIWDFDKDGNVDIYWDKDDDDEIALVTGTVYEFQVADPDETSTAHLAYIYNFFGGNLFKYIGSGDSLNRNTIASIVFRFEDGTTSTAGGTTITSNGELVNENTYSKCTNWELFDGSGFGDNEKFNQLTNGTITDLNGNTVRTYSGFKRTGYYI